MTIEEFQTKLWARIERAESELAEIDLSSPIRQVRTANLLSLMEAYGLTFEK